jgi:flagellar biosynthesis/type III secretory pathway M-ring protein FliF/YscJ
MLQLYPGRRLEPGQVAAIVHLVASSVPELAASDVTLVDQAGSLLNSPDENSESAVSTSSSCSSRSSAQAGCGPPSRRISISR